MKASGRRFSVGAYFPPLGKCGRAIEFEFFSVAKMTFLVEVVVD
jgi:hypothetical protein